LTSKQLYETLLEHHAPKHDEKNQPYIAYHAIEYNKWKQSMDSGRRVMLIRPITYKNGWPYVNGSQQNRVSK
jgi:hypothetical protein